LVLFSVYFIFPLLSRENQPNIRGSFINPPQRGQIVSSYSGFSSGLR